MAKKIKSRGKSLVDDTVLYRLNPDLFKDENGRIMSKEEVMDCLTKMLPLAKALQEEMDIEEERGKVRPIKQRRP